MGKVFVEHDDNLGHVVQFQTAAYLLHNTLPFWSFRVLERRREREGGRREKRKGKKKRKKEKKKE